MASIAMVSREAGVALESVVVMLNEQGVEGPPNEHEAPSFAASAHSLNEGPMGSWLQRNKSRIFGIVSKLAAITSLILTALMAWPAVSSAGDTRTATLLAEWSAQKEFLDFCEAHDWSVDQCPEYEDVVLPPPPTRPTLLRRLFVFRLHTLEHPVLVPLNTNGLWIETSDSLLDQAVRLVSVTLICGLTLFSILFLIRTAATAITALLTRLRRKNRHTNKSKTLEELGEGRMLQGANPSFDMTSLFGPTASERVGVHDDGLWPPDGVIRRFIEIPENHTTTGDAATTTGGNATTTGTDTRYRPTRRMSSGLGSIKRRLHENPPWYGSDVAHTRIHDDPFFATWERDAEIPMLLRNRVTMLDDRVEGKIAARGAMRRKEKRLVVRSLVNLQEQLRG